MSALLLSPAAEEDLIALWAYIAQDNPKAADEVLDAAETTFRKLCATPRIGTLYQSRRVALKGIRSFPISGYNNYIIYYRPTPKGIEIVRVLHAHRDRGRELGQ